MKHKTLTVFVLILWAGVCSSGSSSKDSEKIPRSTAIPATVARVNGAALTERDLRLEMERLFPFYRIHGGRVPPQKEQEIRQKALDRIVLEELLFQEARRQRFQVTSKEVDLRIQRARQSVQSQSAFDQIVTGQFGSQKEFRRRTWRALMAEALWEREVIRPAMVSDSETRKTYAQNQQKFLRPESVWLQTISFLFSANATPAEKEKVRAHAEALLPRARATNSFEAFGALAEKFSADDWRVLSGDHGWVHRGTLERELESAFQLKPGETSGLVTSNVGFHILRVNGRRPSKLLPFVEVKEEIKKSLHEQRVQKRGQQLEQQLRSHARIEIL